MGQTITENEMIITDVCLSVRQIFLVAEKLDRIFSIDLQLLKSDHWFAHGWCLGRPPADDVDDPSDFAFTSFSNAPDMFPT